MNVAVAARHAFRITEFRPLRKNSLVGFATIALPSGMILTDVAVNISNGRAWASPPAKPMISREGAVMRDRDGKVRYAQVIDFETKELRDKFSDAAVAAVRAAHPSVFDE